jgi:hypothetical protein
MTEVAVIDYLAGILLQIERVKLAMFLFCVERLGKADKKL